MPYVCQISMYSGFSGSLFHVLPIKNEIFRGEQVQESIICVRMGWKKSVPCDHRLSSLSKPGDAKG